MELLLGTSVINALLLFYSRRQEAGIQPMKVTKFKESIVDSILSKKHSTSSNACEEEPVHFLRQTDEKENGRRCDRRKRRYCIGCYNKLADSVAEM